MKTALTVAAMKKLIATPLMALALLSAVPFAATSASAALTAGCVVRQPTPALRQRAAHLQSQLLLVTTKLDRVTSQLASSPQPPRDPRISARMRLIQAQLQTQQEKLQAAISALKCAPSRA